MRFMPIDISASKQLKLSFGKDVISATESIREQIPKLEKEVETCDVDSLRLIRSFTGIYKQSRKYI